MDVVPVTPDISIQRRLRSCTRHVPFRVGASLLNLILFATGCDDRPPDWQVSGGVGEYPTMELNISCPFQRRMFYFPVAYWRRLMTLPFGRYIAGTLQPGQTFVDIGASVGFYSLFASHRVGPTGSVFAVEPEPATFESLRRSVIRNRFEWTTCLNVALSDHVGRMPLYTVADGSAHSLVPEIPSRASRYSGQASVRVTTLDRLSDEGVLGTDRIDLIKIDVEGAEARTVEGSLATLERFDFPPVWAEVRGPRGSTRAPNTFPVVAGALENLGYAPFFRKNGQLRKASVSQVQGIADILFRRL